MFDGFLDGDLVAGELAALHQPDKDEQTSEVLCSRVRERRVPRLPVAARIRLLERAERRGRGRGRASMLHARRPKVDDIKPGLQQTQETNIEQDCRLRPEEFPPLTSNTSDPPSRVPTTGYNSSTCDSDTASATDSGPHQAVGTAAARPKTRKTRSTMDRFAFAAQHQDILKDFPSLSDSNMLRPKRVMTLTRSNLDRHSKDMDGVRLSRIHGFVESNTCHPEGVQEEKIYEAFPVTIDDIEMFKHNQSQVPKNVKGRVAGLLNATRPEVDNVAEHLGDLGENVDNLGEEGAPERHELGAQFKGRFSYSDYNSDDSFDSIMSNLSEGGAFEDPEEFEDVGNVVSPPEELTNSHSEFVNSARGDTIRHSVEPPENWEQHYDENHETQALLHNGQGDYSDTYEGLHGCVSESDQRISGHSGLDNEQLAGCIDTLDDIHIGQNGTLSTSACDGARNDLALDHDTQARSIDQLDDINLLGKSPPLCQNGNHELHRDEDDIDDEFSFVEVKHKKKHARRDCGKGREHNTGVDNMIWRLYGPCVMQISGLPAICDISVLREMVAGFGTVQDEQTRLIDNGCSVRFKFVEEDSCQYAVETLHLAESIFPDANCVLNCEKLKH